MKAVWESTVLAESDNTVVIEGNQYFPPDAINREYLEESDRTSTCPWKGEAHYYSVAVEGQKNEDAAWYYPEPSEEAKHIKGYVAFWRGVEIEN